MADKWHMEMQIEYIADAETIKTLINELSKTFWRHTGDLLPAEVTPIIGGDADEEV